MKKTNSFKESFNGVDFLKYAILNASSFEIYHFRDTEVTGMGNYPHWHRFYEMMMIMEGNATIASNGTLYPVDNGSIAIIPPEVMHCTLIPQETTLYDRIIFHWTAELSKQISSLLNLDLSKLFDQLYVIKCDAKLTSEFHILFTHLQEDMHQEDKFSSSLSLTAIEELMLRCARALQSPLEINAKSNTSQKVAEIVAHIREHYQEPDLSLEKIAEEFYFSTGYLSKLFRTYTGVTVYQYIIQCRILHSQYQIADGVSVIEACMDSGFTDYSSFLKSFRKYVGLTPSQYAKSLKGKKQTFLISPGGTPDDSVNRDGSF